MQVLILVSVMAVLLCNLPAHLHFVYASGHSGRRADHLFESQCPVGLYSTQLTCPFITRLLICVVVMFLY